MKNQFGGDRNVEVRGAGGLGVDDGGPGGRGDGPHHSCRRRSPSRPHSELTGCVTHAPPWSPPLDSIQFVDGETILGYYSLAGINEWCAGGEESGARVAGLPAQPATAAARGSQPHSSPAPCCLPPLPLSPACRGWLGIEAAFVVVFFCFAFLALTYVRHVKR